MLVFDGAQSLDISGTLEVFALASRQAQEDGAAGVPPYALRIVARQAGAVTLASGMRLLPDLDCARMPGRIDTLLVSGGMGDALDRARADAGLADWLRAAAGRARRIGSVCNGALLLAEAGLLDGREATTHWSDLAELRRRYPSVRVVPDAIYTRDGRVWTSAGISTGIDMALAMVADDCGRPLASKIARRMVLATRRSGGDSQRGRQLAELDLPDRFADLAQWIRAHLHASLDVGRLSERMHMSPRQFTRRFRAAFGTTPHRYVVRLRIDAARAQLEHTGKDIKRIAADCGFSTEEAMRRSFVRQLGVRPGEYRQRLAAART